MKKTTISASIILLTIAIASAGSRPAIAAPAVSQAVSYTALKGNYSFGSPVNDEGTYPSVGTFTFDGKGHVSGVMSLYNDGAVCDGMTVSGTYSVNPGLASGSALMALTSVNTGGCALAGNGDSIPLILAIGGGGNVLYFAEMDNESAGFFSDDFAFLAGSANRN